MAREDHAAEALLWQRRSKKASKGPEMSFCILSGLCDIFQLCDFGWDLLVP